MGDKSLCLGPGAGESQVPLLDCMKARGIKTWGKYMQRRKETEVVGKSL